MADNSGIINLQSLGSDDSPRWQGIDGNDGFLYSYNPCVPFTSTSLLLSDLAVINTVLLLLHRSITGLKKGT